MGGVGFEGNGQPVDWEAADSMQLPAQVEAVDRIARKDGLRSRTVHRWDVRMATGLGIVREGLVGEAYQAIGRQ